MLFTIFLILYCTLSAASYKFAVCQFVNSKETKRNTGSVNLTETEILKN